MSNWDLDREYGEEGEGVVRRLRRSRHEVKRKRRSDDFFYLEVEQKPDWRGGDWKPSATGPANSQADYLTFVIADTGVVVCFPMELVRTVVEQQERQHVQLKLGGGDGDNPTHGYLVSLADILCYHSVH